MKQDYTYFQIEWAIKNIPSTILNGHEKAILSTLHLCINNKKDTWHGYDSIAKMISFSADTVKRNIKTLEQKGFIKITRPAQYSRTQSNRYTLNYDHIMSYKEKDKVCSELPLSEERYADSMARYADSPPRRYADSPTNRINKTDKRKGARDASWEARRASYPPGFVTLEQYYAELAADPERMAERERRIEKENAWRNDTPTSETFSH
jgi:hypothetical protein